MTHWSVLEGDCLDVMAGMEPASVDEIGLFANLSENSANPATI